VASRQARMRSALVNARSRRDRDHPLRLRVYGQASLRLLFPVQCRFRRLSHHPLRGLPPGVRGCAMRWLQHRPPRVPSFTPSPAGPSRRMIARRAMHEGGSVGIPITLARSDLSGVRLPGRTETTTGASLLTTGSRTGPRELGVRRGHSLGRRQAEDCGEPPSRITTKQNVL